MDTEDDYPDEERNPNALLRAIFHYNCFGVMKGGMSAEETIKNIHQGIEHFAATTGMRLSMISPPRENNDEPYKTLETLLRILDFLTFALNADLRVKKAC